MVSGLQLTGWVRVCHPWKVSFRHRVILADALLICHRSLRLASLAPSKSLPCSGPQPYYSLASLAPSKSLPCSGPQPYYSLASLAPSKSLPCSGPQPYYSLASLAPSKSLPCSGPQPYYSLVSLAPSKSLPCSGPQPYYSPLQICLSIACLISQSGGRFTNSKMVLYRKLCHRW